MIWFWLILAAAALIVELATTALVSIWFTAGALSAAAMAAIHTPLYVQALVFICISAALFVISRQWIVKRFKVIPQAQGAARLIGEIGVVEQTVDPIDGGRILVLGQDWKAVSEDNEQIVKGSRVKISGIEGVKLKVYPIPEEAPLKAFASH